MSGRESTLNGHLERELNYYRRECNDLGARLLRLQEEQSQAFREAQRSRMVVRLLREAYRLGDITSSSGDVGGPMLETVVDNALCDRAALLREEPVGSGTFLISHAIGLPESATCLAARIENPMPFFYTSSRVECVPPGPALTQLLDVPYVLWAYDKASGHALIIGNHIESNINRPFEEGDQEFIEGALSVYLDILYRKQTELRLRQAKRAAEEADQRRQALVQAVGRRFEACTEMVSSLSERLLGEGQVPSGLDVLATHSRALVTAAEQLRTLLDEIRTLTEPSEAPSALEVEWVSAEELTRKAARAAYTTALKRSVDVHIQLPKRRIEICVDRLRMYEVLRHLIANAVRISPPARNVGVTVGRRSDGSFEFTVSIADPIDHEGDGAHGGAVRGALGTTLLGTREEDESLTLARRLVEAHGGTLVIESRLGDGSRTRLLLPVSVTRDAELTGMPGGGSAAGA